MVYSIAESGRNAPLLLRSETGNRRYKMKNLKTFFPLSFTAKDNNSIITLIIIAVVAYVAVGICSWLLGKIPVVGFFIKLLAWLIGLYITATLVIAILVFLKVIKDDVQ